jgi:putative endonuclease
MSIKQWFAEQWRTPSLGERGEQRAARYLRRKGYKVIATRRRTRFCEIDVIAVDGDTVVFAEVKTRRSVAAGRPALAVDALRRRRMTRAATAFLKSHQLLQCPARFDIVEVVWPADARQPAIMHHTNAFPAEGSGQFFR